MTPKIATTTSPYLLMVEMSNLSESEKFVPRLISVLRRNMMLTHNSVVHTLLVTSESVPTP